MPANVILIQNDLPAQIVALSHATLDKAMELAERAHGVVIPSATMDEHGCRSALAEANRLYDQVKDLASELEAHRLERGREISAVKSRLDEAVKAATGPLNDQKQRLGTKLLKAKADLDRVIAEQKAAAERERRRLEEEQRAKAEAARRAELEAERLAVQAAEAARKAAAEAEAAAARGIVPPPDAEADLAAQRAADHAAAAAKAATVARETAIDATFAPPAQRYVPPAPKMSVRASTNHDLVIDDLGLVPLRVGGALLWKLDESTCKKLLKAGAEIPGMHLVEVEGSASKGRSNAFSVD